MAEKIEFVLSIFLNSILKITKMAVFLSYYHNNLSFLNVFNEVGPGEGVIGCPDPQPLLAAVGDQELDQQPGVRVDPL